MTINEFHVKTTIDPMMILNLLVNAFDNGAINYWVKVAEPAYPEGFDVSDIAWLKNPEWWKEISKIYFAPLVKGGSITFHLYDEDECAILNLESIQRGLEVMMETYPRHWGDFISRI